MMRDEYKTLLRLYVSRENISGGERHELSDGQHHYLRNVMRLQPGDRLRCFNGVNGEWLAEVEEINKKKLIITFLEKIHEQVSSPDLWVVASPVKKEALDMMIEKSSELGAARFVPVVCDRTVVHRINTDRLSATATEAAEQCERLDVMAVHPLEKLKTVLETWDTGRKLIFCIERMEARPLLKALQSLPGEAPLAVLVGPEGGFSPAEAEYIAALPFVVPVTLGSRILKAETALIAALAVVQAVGDSR
jgi:16S rRNA (uracil1498-N3)-methyltransferase